MINFEKSSIIFIANVSIVEQDQIAQMLDMRVSTDPESYLGLPNMIGRKKKTSFHYLKDRVIQRIGSWSTRILFTGW